MNDKTLLYLYDLPKDQITSNKIAAKIKELTKYEIGENPQIRRDPNKPFYTAIIKVNEPEKFKEVVQAMKYFDIEGKPCRGLPYQKELLAVNRAATNKGNVFIKGLPKEVTSAQLEQTFKGLLGDVVIAAKVSINMDYSSRGYGFVLFKTEADALKAIQLSEQLGWEMVPYQPKDRREIRKAFNNIYVKNFPLHWDEARLREIFQKYGNIKSLAVMRAKVPGQEEEAPFAFICYEDPVNKEYGPECAARAVDQENNQEYEGHIIYVKEALKKEEREAEKRKEQLRFKNSKKRCNLYVKNFPPTTTEPELRTLFEKYGEIESIKLLPKEGEALYAFVCYKSPDSAALAKQQLNLQTFNNKQLYINNYELKEVRKIQQEDARDKADFQSFKKQSPTALSLDILNKPEIYQLIQYLMIHLNRQNQFRGQGGFQNRQPRGPRQPYQQQPGQMPRPQQMPSQPQGQMQPPMMMNRPPMGQPQPMPIAQFQSQPPMMTQMAQMSIPPHILEYQQNGMRLIPAVSPANPNYKGQVGEHIYEFVEKIAGENQAPKITGMLIDLPIPDIQAYLADYNKLVIKVNEANSLLNSQQ